MHLLEPIRHEDKIFEAILTNTEEGMQIQLQEVTIGFVGAESKLEVTNAHLLSGSANRKVEYDPATQKIRIVDGTQTVTDRIDIQEAREFDATVDTQVVA